MFPKRSKTQTTVEWSKPTKAVKYPKWSYVQVDNEYFLVQEKTKKKFISSRAALSWSSIFLPGTKQSLSNYKLDGQLGFRSGSLVQPVGLTQQYMISDNKRYLIATPDFYTILGFDGSKAIIISLDELDWHQLGGRINEV